MTRIRTLLTQATAVLTALPRGPAGRDGRDRYAVPLLGLAVKWHNHGAAWRDGAYERGVQAALLGGTSPWRVP